MVCPPNGAGITGCAVYFTRDDVTAPRHQGANRRRLLATQARNSRKLLQSCGSGAVQGAIQGAITGVLSTGDCLKMGDSAPFCIVGMIGANAALGAVCGCASSCFPGNLSTSPLRAFPVNSFTIECIGSLQLDKDYDQPAVGKR
jgi:hypothetical protein